MSRSNRTSTTKATKALTFLKDADAKLGELIEEVGAYRLPVNELQSTYEALAESIIYQQITGKAAASIHNKVIAGLGEKGKDDILSFPSPQKILEADLQTLRSCGLSQSKALSLQDLARHSLSGQLPEGDELAALEDQEIIDSLVTIRGIGPWTVQMLLIFRLGRENVMPHTDYGIRKGFTRTFPRHGKKAKDGLATPQSVLSRAERWQPYRTCASWYLWRATEL